MLGKALLGKALIRVALLAIRLLLISHLRTWLIVSTVVWRWSLLLLTVRTLLWVVGCLGSLWTAALAVSRRIVVLARHVE